MQDEPKDGRRSPYVSGKGNCRRLTPGYRFSLTGHTKETMNRGYMLITVEHEGEQPQVLKQTAGSQGSYYSNQIIAIPDDIPYRPPARKKPPIYGVQVAVVTGPEGEEICVAPGHPWPPRHKHIRV